MTTDRLICARSLLQQHGIQPTIQRTELAELALSVHQHFSAEQILERASSRGSNVSRATVYNTLNLFVQKELLKEILIDPSRILYDSNTSSHHHKFNVDTGELTDIDQVEFQVEQYPQLTEHEELETVELVFRVRNRQV